MDVRRFYVISPRGEQGPFSVEELNEEFSAGRVTPQQQVRTGMGTMLGTVREVLIAPEALWNTAESGSGLTAVAVAQRRTRMVSLVILGLTLVPALLVMFLLGDKQPGNTGGSASAFTAPAAPTGPTPRVIPPPPAAVTPIPSTSSPSARPATATTTPSTASRSEAATNTGVVRQQANGVLTLTATSAIITSEGARLQDKGGDNPHIGSWNNKDGGLEWNSHITKPGRFRVVMTYACNRSGAGAILTLAAGGTSLNDTVQDTGSWDIYKPHTLARELTIATSGPVTISLSPHEKKSSAFMKLSGIVLTPVDGPR